MAGYVDPCAAARSLQWSDEREAILDRYLALLARVDSPLLRAGDDVLTQVRAQLLGVVDAVAEQVGIDTIGHRSTPTPAAGTAQLSETIGRSRANAGIHPSQSLQAAACIFEAALPSFTERLSAAGDENAAFNAGVVLNREILQRMASAARAYVDYLLDKAHGSNRDERRRLSRELHDVAAPAVAIGLQNLEMLDYYSGTDPRRAGQKLDAARRSLNDALATIRSLSAQTRDAVAGDGLAAAISRYAATIPTGIATSVTVDGDLGALPLAYAEELFLIVREAMRNAVEHAHPTCVAVHLHATSCELRAEVVDDGGGFDVTTSSHVGLESMRERAELLDAKLSITSAVNGTTVTVLVPLPYGVGSPGVRS